MFKIYRPVIYIIVTLILVATQITLVGCGSGQQTTGTTTPTTTTPATTTPPTVTTPVATTPVELVLPSTAENEKRLDVEKIFSGGDGSGLCYLGSYAMLAHYADGSIDFTYVIASSGLGASAVYLPEINLMMNGYSIGCIGNAAVNQGFDYYLSGLSGAILTDDFFAKNLTDDATDIMTTQNGEEAFDLLKRVLSAGIPVMVHLDINYIKETLIANTSYYQLAFAFAGAGHLDHYMVVTGYDGEYVYLNDPTEPEENMGKDIPAEISDFLDAWANGNNAAIDPSARIGPYWMLFLGQRGTAKTVEELIACNYDIAANAIQDIRDAAVNPNINPLMHCNEMMRARLEFGNFLIANGYQEAGDIFIEISEIFHNLDVSSTKQADLLRIADLQEEALGKL